MKLGHVALDGTKIKANASRHKAMSYGRMKRPRPKLRPRSRRGFRAADGGGCRGGCRARRDRAATRLPDWVADKQQRLERMRAAKAALEAEAKAPPPADDDGPGPSTGMHGSRQAEAGARWRAAGPRAAQLHRSRQPHPEDRDGFVRLQRPDRRRRRASDHRRPARSTNAADRGALVPLVEAIRGDLGRPQELSGRCRLLPTRPTSPSCTSAASPPISPRAAPATAPAIPPATARRKGSRVAAMATKLRRAGHRSRYRLRKQIVEPVFGHIKPARGFRQFSSAASPRSDTNGP